MKADFYTDPEDEKVENQDTGGEAPIEDDEESDA